MDQDKTNGPILFGTDGYRAIIAEGFTTEKVQVLSQGVCEYIEHDILHKGSRPKVVIGYDCRFLSDLFARRAAEVFCANQVQTILSKDFCTTPAVSQAVVSQKADLGIMITASHNPYPYNGYKIKGPFGGSATMDIVQKIEARVNEGVQDGLYYKTSPQEGGCKVTESDLSQDYMKAVCSLVDIDAIRAIDFDFLIDPMYGAGQKVFYQKIEELAPGRASEIHSVFNPAFGGINPEPIGSNLNEAAQAVRQKGLALAVCLDGDGDRIGALDEDGSFVSSHHIFAIVLESLIRQGQTDGRVVKTVSTSSVIDRICRQNRIDLITTPVGFKYIADQILQEKIIMGGEESGGLWFSPNVPERDGILLGLKLLEIVSRRKASLKEVLKDIYERYGYFEYARKDYGIDSRHKAALVRLLKEKVPQEVKDSAFAELVRIDGFKYVLEDGSWVMIRPSGTEDVVRVYAEGKDSKQVQTLQEIGHRVIQSARPVK